MWCHYYDKNNYNTEDKIAFYNSNYQKKIHFEAKAFPGKKSLAFLLKEINALKRHLKPAKEASFKKSISVFVWITNT
jgi:hypothetical protein